MERIMLRKRACVGFGIKQVIVLDSLSTADGRF